MFPMHTIPLLLPRSTIHSIYGWEGCFFRFVSVYMLSISIQCTLLMEYQIMKTTLSYSVLALVCLSIRASSYQTFLVPYSGQFMMRTVSLFLPNSIYSFHLWLGRLHFEFVRVYVLGISIHSSLTTKLRRLLHYLLIWIQFVFQSGFNLMICFEYLCMPISDAHCLLLSSL